MDILLSHLKHAKSRDTKYWLRDFMSLRIQVHSFSSDNLSNLTTDVCKMVAAVCDPAITFAQIVFCKSFFCEQVNLSWNTYSYFSRKKNRITLIGLDSSRFIPRLERADPWSIWPHNSWVKLGYGSQGIRSKCLLGRQTIG